MQRPDPHAYRQRARVHEHQPRRLHWIREVSFLWIPILTYFLQPKPVDTFALLSGMNWVTSLSCLKSTGDIELLQHSPRTLNFIHISRAHLFQTFNSSGKLTIISSLPVLQQRLRTPKKQVASLATKSFARATWAFITLVWWGEDPEITGLFSHPNRSRGTKTTRYDNYRSLLT